MDYVSHYHYQDKSTLSLTWIGEKIHFSLKLIGSLCSLVKKMRQKLGNPNESMAILRSTSFSFPQICFYKNQNNFYINLKMYGILNAIYLFGRKKSKSGNFTNKKFPFWGAWPGLEPTYSDHQSKNFSTLLCCFSNNDAYKYFEDNF